MDGYFEEAFASLRTFKFDDDLWHHTTGYTKEMHPMYGIARPDLSERNRKSRGSKWSKPTPHFNSGRSHSETTKAKHRSNRLGTKRSSDTKSKMSDAAKIASNRPEELERRRNLKSIPVTVGGTRYPSKKAARLDLGISFYTLQRLLSQEAIS